MTQNCVASVTNEKRATKKRLADLYDFIDIRLYYVKNMNTTSKSFSTHQGHEQLNRDKNAQPTGEPHWKTMRRLTLLAACLLDHL